MKKGGVQAILPFVGFSVALFAFSSVVPFVLLWGGSTLLNLSLLTSDIWTGLARQAFFGKPFFPLQEASCIATEEPGVLN